VFDIDINFRYQFIARYQLIAHRASMSQIALLLSTEWISLKINQRLTRINMKRARVLKIARK